MTISPNTRDTFARRVDAADRSAAPVRHGVSVVRPGRRHTLGLVFHDAG
ncbi:2OG-Fe(II) oxygenase [Actinacidiphila sp. ITFR-21]|nr:2OG-Fe(II) oxygenase [Streptomyces sp. ITFR-21]WNI17070.1 2OG-Fe(II) oxygenase [Streptomyces sp. ITFR-21]